VWRSELGAGDSQASQRYRERDTHDVRRLLELDFDLVYRMSLMWYCR